MDEQATIKARNAQRRRARLVLAAYVGLTVSVGIAIATYVDRQFVKDLVDRSGTGGMVVFALVEYVYILLVPIFNTPIHLAAGYLFGGLTGWIINFISTTAALFTIVAMVRTFGRPLIRRAVQPDLLAKYDSATERIGPLSLFLVYVAPGFPDDELTYLAASGAPSFSRYVLPIVLGNIAKTSTSYLGDEGAAGLPMAIASRIVILAVGLVLIGLQERYARQRARATAS